MYVRQRVSDCKPIWLNLTIVSEETFGDKDGEVEKYEAEEDEEEEVEDVLIKFFCW